MTLKPLMFCVKLINKAGNFMQIWIKHFNGVRTIKKCFFPVVSASVLPQPVRFFKNLINLSVATIVAKGEAGLSCMNNEHSVIYCL